MPDPDIAGASARSFEEDHSIAGRSHCFSLASRFCMFCHRPMTFFHEHGFGYCSASWTGRPIRPLRAHWRLGPLEWTRVGVAAMLVIGPLHVAFIGRLWRASLKPMRLVEV